MANVNIRVDDNLKRDTESILSELGISISAATNMFYKQVVRYGGIPLDLRVSPVYSYADLLLADAKEAEVIYLRFENAISRVIGCWFIVSSKIL